MPHARSILWLILVAALVSVLSAATLPITLDEAYYHQWGQELAFGYFDHPPGVALLAAISEALPLPFLNSRFGTLLVGIGSLILAIRLFWVSGLQTWPSLLLAILLFKFNVGCLSSGILTGPDAFLIFFWLLALHEGFFALKGQKRRWLTAGLASGCGLLAKYAMVLIGPIFLLALLKDPRRSLRTPWPYLGGLLAVLIFLPNLYWNATHNWASFSFQLRRLSSVEIPSQSALPSAELYTLTGPEWELAKKLASPAALRKSLPALNIISETPFYLTSLHMAEFLGGVLMLWGFLLFPLSTLLWRKPKSVGSLHPQAQTLFSYAVWVPLIFFGMIAFFTKVEANWPAIYMIAAAPLLAPALMAQRKEICAASIANTLAILLLCFHGAKPFLPSRSDRILKETHGFSPLANRVEKLSDPIFADTYQLVSILRFYLPHREIFQWPGINRPSEWTQNQKYSFSYAELKLKKELWLLSTELIPPRIPGFQPTYMELINDCKTDNTLFIQSSDRVSSNLPPCLSPHQWSLVHYELH